MVAYPVDLGGNIDQDHPGQVYVGGDILNAAGYHDGKYHHVFAARTIVSASGGTEILEAWFADNPFDRITMRTVHAYDKEPVQLAGADGDPIQITQMVFVAVTGTLNARHSPLVPAIHEIRLPFGGQ